MHLNLLNNYYMPYEFYYDNLIREKKNFLNCSSLSFKKAIQEVLNLRSCLES